MGRAQSCAGAWRVYAEEIHETRQAGRCPGACAGLGWRLPWACDGRRLIEAPKSPLRNVLLRSFPRKCVDYLLHASGSNRERIAAYFYFAVLPISHGAAESVVVQALQYEDAAGRMNHLV